FLTGLLAGLLGVYLFWRLLGRKMRANRARRINELTRETNELKSQTSRFKADQRSARGPEGRARRTTPSGRPREGGAQSPSGPRYCRRQETRRRTQEPASQGRGAKRGV